MTQNQISFAKVAEDTRHNKATEKLSKQQNKITQEHYTKQDTYTPEHYERSDAAAAISANASAMNAQTSRKQYDLQHAIEYDYAYGTFSDSGYPANMPLSAQLKSAQIRKEAYEGELVRKEYENKDKQIELENTNKTTKSVSDVSKALSDVFNALYGKRGFIGVMETIIDDNP